MQIPSVSRNTVFTNAFFICWLSAFTLNFLLMPFPTSLEYSNCVFFLIYFICKNRERRKTALYSKLKIDFHNTYCTPKSAQLVAPINGSAKSVYAEFPLSINLNTLYAYFGEPSTFLIPHAIPSLIASDALSTCL